MRSLLLLSFLQTLWRSTTFSHGFLQIKTPQQEQWIKSKSQKAHIIGFFKEKEFDDDRIDMFRRCRQLELLERESVRESWDYLKSIGIQERKLPHVVSKCPKILVLWLDEMLVLMVQCLATLGTKTGEVATAITKFPNILVHSIEEKLCPLPAFFQALGIPEKRAGKLVLLNPKLISHNIDTKFSEVVGFLVGLGLDRDGMVGKILVKHPFIMPKASILMWSLFSSPIVTPRPSLRI